MGAIEAGNGALVAALPVGAVAHEVVDGLPFGQRLIIESGTHAQGGEDFVALHGFVGLRVQGRPVEREAFGDVEAAEGPLAVGDLLDGEFLAFGLGGVDAEKFGVEGYKGGGVLGSEDNVALDGETKFEGVLRGAGLALLSARTGGMGGVGAVACGGDGG